jgi:hypothetical protein
MGGRIQPPFGRIGKILPLIWKVIYFSSYRGLFILGARFYQFYQFLPPPFQGGFLILLIIPPKSTKKIKIE